MPSVPSLPSRTERGGDTVVIRRATAADAPALERLARLDSAPGPLRGAILVAESGGELRAARALDDGRTIADPFHPAAGLIALLETRAALLRGPGPARTRGPGTLRRRLQPRAALR